MLNNANNLSLDLSQTTARQPIARLNLEELLQESFEEDGVQHGRLPQQQQNSALNQLARSAVGSYFGIGG